MSRAGNPVAARERMTQREIARGETDSFLREHLDEWLDHMTRRLFEELERQLCEVETAMAPPAKPDVALAGENLSPGARDSRHRQALEEEIARAALREKNARSLAAIERTLERLNALQERRAKARAQQEKRNDESRKRLARLVARRAAAERTGGGDRGDGG